MRIKLLALHKSIRQLTEFELPSFTVLTGKNGSGKSHLLEAISNNSLALVSVNGKVLSNIRYIEFNGLNPRIQETCDPTVITQYIKKVWQEFLVTKDQSLQRAGGTVTDESIISRMGDIKTKLFIQKVFSNTKKKYSEITEDDLNDNFDVTFLEDSDFFTAQFALIFKNYHRLWIENDENSYYESKGIEPLSVSLSNEDFIIKNGVPPWDFVNTILEETEIPYEVNNPMGTRKDSSFKFKLKDRKEGFEISSQNLSTGEKVLMSLALAIYNGGEGFGKPDLLLIDEPDAALHPSMSQKMVRVLQKNIVEKSAIPTIITTHSPTTVIACEGISIYQLERGNNAPTKISSQKAIETLSSDIPFLKISNEKRRQVFVESKYDVQYYELISNILSRLEKLPSEPIFIPARSSSGSNCQDVIEIVSNLFENGNDQIYGIVDWDTKNKPKGRVIVLGHEDRYSIENYLLDPLKMGLLFIRERKIEISEFGDLSFANYTGAANMTKEDAQKIIDKILRDLELNSSNALEYTLYNGWKLNITREFALHQGHELECLYKKKYPFLKVYQKEDAMKKDIIEKIINDLPSFTASKLFNVIHEIK